MKNLRTAEEIINSKKFRQLNFSEFKKCIKTAQREAWNKALDEAIEKANQYEEYSSDEKELLLLKYLKQSILDLKVKEV